MQYKNGLKTLENKPKEQNDEEKPESELLNFDKPDFKFIPKANCQFSQQGPYLICYSCELQHAVWVGMKKIMVGIDDKGQPILKDRDLGRQA
jgi:hypothetical protein